MSDRKLASIEKIISLEPIKGKDRIELATILGWHCIVGKEEFKVGDYVVYCQYDTLLPIKPEFEFLRNRCYSKKFDGMRIRNMKMAGVYSEGIVFKVKDIKDLDALSEKQLYEGKDVSEIIGVQKYDIESLEEVEKAKVSRNPIIKYLMRYKWFRKWIGNRKPKYGYPEGVHKANETNIQVIFNRLKDKDLLYYKSEKLEGQACTYLVTNKGRFMVFSHNVGLPKSNNNWWRIAEKFNIERKIKNFMKLYDVNEMYIGGEIIGPGIQRNIYGLNDLDMYIYNIISLDNNRVENKIFGLNDMRLFCNVTGLKMVPVLEENVKLLESSDAILEDCEGESIFNSSVKGLREGIIWRSNCGKYGFKAKSKKYQDLWNKKEKTE